MSKPSGCYIWTASLCCVLLAAGMNQAPRTLSYNPAENAVLLTSDVDGGSYELYSIPKDARGETTPVSTVTCTHTRHVLQQ